MERRRPAPQEIYRHFKNQLYQIITIAKHSETDEELVVYQALYGNYHVCARPLSMFMSEVDHEKYPDVKQKYRFEKVDFSKENEKKQESVKIKKEEKTEEKKEIKEEEQGQQANPDLLEFLDADTMEEKRRVLIGMRTRITDRLINDLAASLDVTVEQGDLDARYKDLLYCVETKQKFEVERRR